MKGKFEDGYKDAYISFGVIIGTQNEKGTYTGYKSAAEELFHNDPPTAFLCKDKKDGITYKWIKTEYDKGFLKAKQEIFNKWVLGYGTNTRFKDGMGNTIHIGDLVYVEEENVDGGYSFLSVIAYDYDGKVSAEWSDFGGIDHEFVPLCRFKQSERTILAKYNDSDEVKDKVWNDYGN